jgi:AcrR family transcriptional regulator
MTRKPFAEEEMDGTPRAGMGRRRAAAVGATPSRNGRNISSADILKAATVVFSEHGYRGSNLQHVAGKLGVTRQAIYYYYPNKHAILLSLFEHFFDQLDDAVEAVLVADSDPALRFEKLVRAHMRCVASKPELSAIFTKEYGSLLPEARDAVRERRRRYHQAFVEAYENGRDLGELRDLPVHPTVSLTLGAVNWIFRWYRGTPPIEDLTDIAITLFRDGYRVREDGDS